MATDAQGNLLEVVAVSSGRDLSFTWTLCLPVDTFQLEIKQSSKCQTTEGHSLFRSFKVNITSTEFKVP